MNVNKALQAILHSSDKYKMEKVDKFSSDDVSDFDSTIRGQSVDRISYCEMNDDSNSGYENEIDSSNHSDVGCNLMAYQSLKVI